MMNTNGNSLLDDLDLCEMLLIKCFALHLQNDTLVKELDRLPIDYLYRSSILTRLMSISTDCRMRNKISPTEVLMAYIKVGGDEESLRDILNDQALHFGNYHRNAVQDIVDHFVTLNNYSKMTEILDDYKLGRIEQSEIAYCLETVAETNVRSIIETPFSDIMNAYGDQDYDPAIDVFQYNLNKRMGGLRRNRMTLLAARPGVGKTDFALSVTRLALKSNLKVFFVSLEMGGRELLKRLYNATPVNDREYLRKLTVCDEGTVRVSQIAAVANKYDLVIIDYLQNLTPSDKTNGLYEETTRLSNELRVAAKHSEAAWLVLCQLSRFNNTGKAEDENVRPRLSNLRGSGSLEQDSYAVLTLHETKKRDDKENDQSRVVAATITKNRGGRLGTNYYEFVMGESIWNEITYEEAQGYDAMEAQNMRDNKWNGIT